MTAEAERSGSEHDDPVAGVPDPGLSSWTPATTLPLSSHPRRIAWLLGWAIPAPWFAAIAKAEIPDAQHHFFVPSPSVLDALEAAGSFDVIYGYSLGSLLLLQNADRVSRLGRVELLAPIFAFPCEEALGGRISRTQVRQLVRWLRRDPTAALADFYMRAGLSGMGILPVDFDLADLLWGLERLEHDRVAPPLPATWRASCGENDALLDATQLHALDPRIEIVPNATHHPAGLIRACMSDVSNEPKC